VSSVATTLVSATGALVARAVVSLASPDDPSSFEHAAADTHAISTTATTARTRTSANVLAHDHSDGCGRDGYRRVT
jgi:hypothetical protein